MPVSAVAANLSRVPNPLGGTTSGSGEFLPESATKAATNSHDDHERAFLEGSVQPDLRAFVLAK